MAAPKLVSASNRPFPVTVEVVFDSAMMGDGELTNPGNYVFNKGAYVTVVEILDDTTVRLFVENLFEHDAFFLTVQNVKNSSGEEIDSTNNTAYFPINRPNVPGYALTITSANGRLKSGTNVLKIDEDSDHWYVMTESGVDIINRTSLRNEGFILDGYGYGFNTIHVSRN